MKQNHRMWPQPLAELHGAKGVHRTPEKFIFLPIITDFHHVCTLKPTFLSVVAPCVHHGPLSSNSATVPTNLLLRSAGRTDAESRQDVPQVARGWWMNYQGDEPTRCSPSAT